jgi:ASPIC and UnbV/FG-GAP-like repeat/FG-GAP repeat
LVVSALLSTAGVGLATDSQTGWPVSFSDVSDLLREPDGNPYQGLTFGIAWGDLNGDGLPDIYANHHTGRTSKHSTVWLNQSSSGFRALAENILGDKHGPAWADFDNDFDMDLIELVGGGAGNASEPHPWLDNHLFVNNNGKLINQAANFGVGYSLSRGRTPSWFDANNDGKLDFFDGVDPRKDGRYSSTIFVQQDGHFSADPSVGKGLSPDLPYALPIDIDRDGDIDLVALDTFQEGVIVFRRNGSAYTPEPLSPKDEFVGDMQVGDFNNDGRFDILATTPTVSPIWAKLDDETLRVLLLPAPPGRSFFEFRSNGPTDFDLSFVREKIVDNIFVGSSGWHPQTPVFTLDPNDKRTWGEPTGPALGTSVWYDPEKKTWSMRQRPMAQTPESKKFIVHAAGGVHPVSPQYETHPAPARDYLYLGSRDGFVEAEDFSGGYQSSGWNVAVGDFDNDMDLDIIVLNATTMGNLPTAFYENDGSGRFQVHELPGPTTDGIGRNIATADYNADGFLDLVIGNGGGPEQFVPRGGYQLLRNDGNGNHWIEIDLKGVSSNFDAIGAIVEVTAGGIKQIRSQSNGMHVYTQDFARLHFGLGENRQADEIRVVWPDGREQSYTDIPADQVIEIVERTDRFSAGEPQGPADGLRVWQNPTTGRFRLSFDGAEPGNYVVRALATDSDPMRVDGWHLPAGFKIFASGSSLAVFGRLDEATGWLDFESPSGSDILLSVEINGVANPRQVRFGPDGVYLPTSAWLQPLGKVGAMAPRPAVAQVSMDAGVDPDGKLVFNFDGDGRPGSHRFDLDIWSTQKAVFDKKGISADEDGRASGANALHTTFTLSDAPAAVTMTGGKGPLVGVRLTKDGIAQRRQAVFGDDGGLGRQNAYFLENAVKP